ncbi:MAG TPA: hypothetical protein VNU66_07195, partial [Mycobacteriales bacterium]|nr:hypothetical protein [Mycobacteriales bacterium]
TVTVTWARAVGPDRSLVEPDVRWSVSDGVARTEQVAPSACTGGTCKAVFTYPDGESGPRSYTVSATRPCSGCSNGPTSSTPTQPVVVPVVPGATPSTPGASPEPGSSPSPGSSPGAPSSGGTTGGTSGGTGRPAPSTGGSGVADPGSFARSFGSFSAKLGLPKLPPLPEAQSPAVAAPQLPDGTFEDSLDYGARELDDDAEAPEVASGRGGTLTSTEGPLGDEQLVRGVAAALVLVLSGAHLRAWLGRTEPDEA